MSLVPTKEEEAEAKGYADGYLAANGNERHFNRLTPSEHERLTILFEEMAEATQIVGKTLRHGYESYNPFNPAKETNRSLLETELGHVMYAIDMLVKGDDVEYRNLISSYKAKDVSIKKYLHHQDPIVPASFSRYDGPTTGAFVAATPGRQHDWVEQGRKHDRYKVCTRCSLSDSFVRHFLTGADALCKVKP